MLRPVRTAALLVTLALSGACANSSVPSSTGRGDAGSGRDGGPGGRDGGGEDAGVGSDGGPDAGPVETCTPGEEDLCTTECGTTGRRTCGSAGTFGACAPPEEDCNGADDDCDGSVDEGVASRACSSECGGGSETCESGSWSGCTATMPRDEVCDGTDNDCDSLIDEGLMRGCSTACGSGTETCMTGTWLGCTAPRPTTESCNGIDDDCNGTVDDGLSRACSTACGSGTETCAAGTWGACSAPAPGTETCNGDDDDCDGTTDEGFRALVQMVTYTTLSGRHSGCDGTTERMGLACNAAIHRHCAMSACHDSGFGPVENAGDDAWVTCVAGEVRHTTYATLASHHAPCDGTTERIGRNCNAAIHRYCQAAGFASGFGPDENSSGELDVTCVDSAIAEVRTTSYTTLATHHSPCDGTTERFGPSCNAAIHRYCQAAGFTSGFGPVENIDDTALVTCVRP